MKFRRLAKCGSPKLYFNGQSFKMAQRCYIGKYDLLTNPCDCDADTFDLPLDF